MTRTPAQNFASVTGVILVALGVIGLFTSAHFGAPGPTGDVLGLFRMNGYDDLLDLLVGLIGLGVAAHAGAARVYAGGLGLVWITVAIWGLALGSTGEIISVFPVNTGDNVLHAVLGLLGIGAWLGSYEKPGVAARLR